MMRLSWIKFREALDNQIPPGSIARKLLQIVSIVLLFEGISVMVLFSYVGFALGLASLCAGLFLLILLTPKIPSKQPLKGEEPLGIRLIDTIVQLVGGDVVVSAAGLAVILLVGIYNWTLSPRPGFGDLDTLSIMFGLMLMLYPFLVKKFKTEATFSLLFIALVVVFLVVPQAVNSFAENSSSSSAGNWYVHYMLASPFAGTLNLLGIHASSSGSYVTMELRDGTPLSLGISAYCAGLYSFSIFLAAFFSFVLVFERLPARMTAVVLVFGLAIAYLGNLVRMVIIGIVGYYRGVDALLWAHRNVGWIIFLSWSALFWYIVLKYAGSRSSGGSSRPDAE